MNKVIISFILTSLAGLSTLLGYFIIYFTGNKDKFITFSLSLASGVMLTISLIDLIPSSFHYLNKYNILFRLLLMSFSFSLGAFLSYYISLKIKLPDSNSLKKVGIISMIAIILHNIPEGIINFLVSGQDLKLGIKLAIVTCLHNIPEGISISVPFYYATNQKFKTFLIVFIAGFSEIIGTLLSYLFLEKIINDFLMGIMFSIIAGIMMNISLTELLPETFKYNQKRIIYLGFIIGVLILVICNLIF